jgi:hypothetical protein
VAEARYPGEADDGDLIEKFSRWGRDIDAHQSAWITEARDCFDLVAGEQWSKDEREMLDDALRPHVTFNSVGPVIDAVSGAEIQGRQQVTYLPRQVGASAGNEVLTKGSEWIRDRCDAEQEESDAARDCFICGVGVTETHMDYEEDPDGQVRIDRRDPIEFGQDPSSRKPNYIDARYIRRKKPYSLEEFEEEWPGAAPGGRDDALGKRVTIVEPKLRYTNGELEENQDELDSVIVTEWQWFEREPYYRVAHPDTGEVVEVSDDDYQEVQAQAQQTGVELGGVRQVRRQYYRAFEASGEILHVEKLDVGEFTYKFMTGKRDRNKGIWYGLVRPMKDPQKYKNKFFSQILHILNTNAKGGLMMEASAAVDQRQFEDSYASPDEISWVADGALSGPNGKRFMIKEPPSFPIGQEKLMEISAAAVQESTGVNKEVLGLADRDQPGVLEHQRKQAAYGILSPFFDSFKRYRKVQGRLMLRMMQLFLPKDTLVRIVGDDGLAQYVPMAIDDEFMKFDVIVDDAPAGPNQKDQAFQILMQLLPILQNADLPPDVWAEFVRYSPLPNALSEKIVQSLMKMAQAQSQPSPQQQLAEQGAQAKIAETAASAQHHTAQANVLNAKAASITAGGHSSEVDANEAKAALDRSKVAAETLKAIAAYQSANQPPLTSPQ